MFSEDITSKSAASNDLLFQGAVGNPDEVLELKLSLGLVSSWYFPNVPSWVFISRPNGFILRLFQDSPQLQQ